MSDTYYLEKKRKNTIVKLHQLLEENPLKVGEIEKELTNLKIYNERILWTTEIKFKQLRFKRIAKRFNSQY